MPVFQSLQHPFPGQAPSSAITIEILDSDNGSDDSMGNLSVIPATGRTQAWTDAYTSSGQARVTATVSAVPGHAPGDGPAPGRTRYPNTEILHKFNAALITP